MWDKESTHWHTQGSCRRDPDAFFPFGKKKSEEAAAKAVCATCPVRLLCLDQALVDRERFGIWGGATARERAQMLRLADARRQRLEAA